MTENSEFLAGIWVFDFCQAINKHRLIYIFITFFFFTRLQTFQVFHILWSKCQQGHSKKYRNSQRCFAVTERHQFRSKGKKKRETAALGSVVSTSGEDLKELCGCVLPLTGKILVDTSQLLLLEQCDPD